MSDELPAPLVPAEVDLRDFGFMPLEVLRLRDSDLATVATGDEFKAAVLLWAVAWHQVPAGSVPNDDRWLAKHSGAGPKWKKVRTEALRGFTLCSDGRLYHGVVAEKALEAWAQKREQRIRTLKARIAGAEKRLKDAVTAEEKQHIQTQLQTMRHDLSQSLSQAQAPPVTSHVTRHVTTDVTASKGTKGTGTEGNGRDHEGTGTLKGTDLELQELKNLDAGASPPTSPRATGQAKTAETWTAYSAAYHIRYGEHPVRNARVNSQLVQFVERIGMTESPAVAAFYVTHNAAFYAKKGHAVGVMLNDAEKLRTEWASGRARTETEAHQGDRTQAVGNVWGKLIEEAGHGK